MLRQGVVSCDGRLWTRPELQAHVGERVTILKPKFHGFDALPVRDERGELIDVARPQQALGYLDREGARYSERAARRHRRATLAQLATDPKLDVERVTSNLLARQPAFR